ncbi:hypothetical protein DRQ25_05080 [Candidatus Fermentibacteria bacterium]|nr:MAG: hypothetical protein DRQ25_05080 [Candidatus Fermentibacteria bacterium]
MRSSSFVFQNAITGIPLLIEYYLMRVSYTIYIYTKASPDFSMDSESMARMLFVSYFIIQMYRVEVTELQ